MNKKIKIIIIIVVMILLIAFGDDIAKKTVYPKNYETIVDVVNYKYDVNENLIYAIMKVESNFKEDIISKAGAKGLMQIMDDTGKQVAEQIGIENFNSEMLFNPEINIEIGTKYYKDLLTKYNNDTYIALIAYNAGQGNVDKWLEEGIISYNNIETLYNVPFEETKLYWQKVKREYDAYEIIYPND